MFRRWVSKLLLGALILVAGGALADSIITGSKPFTFIPGTTISSSQVNADFDYIINQVNTNAAKNGANSSITSLLGLTTPIDPTVGGSSIWNATTIGGTANAITVSATRPAISSFAYATGNIIIITPTATNTAATTVNVNSLGVKNILKTSFSGPIALSGGELVIGVPAALFYDGTQLLYLNIPNLFGTKTSIASAGTTDLGTVGTHFALITGTTGITAFGSSANTAEPLYLAKFAGALTITFNGTSLITPGSGNIVTSAADVALLEYLGSGNWSILSYFPATAPLSNGSANGLTITNNAGTPTTQIDIATAGRSVLENTSGGTISIAAASFTINAATTGANGLDAGSLANNTWYYNYIISNGSTTAGLMSTSATAPTMPSGYVYKYRVGTSRTAGAATFLRLKQNGNVVRYQVVAASTTPNLPIINNAATGSITVPTYTSTSYANFFPPTATILEFLIKDAGSGAIAAPNNAYGAIGSVANPPPCASQSDAAGRISVSNCRLIPESGNIFIASAGANAVIYASGWVDAVNAN